MTRCYGIGGGGGGTELQQVRDQVTSSKGLPWEEGAGLTVLVHRGKAVVFGLLWKGRFSGEGQRELGVLEEHGLMGPGWKCLDPVYSGLN